jgi:CysZ protein
MVRPAVEDLVIGAGLLPRGLSLVARRPRLFLLGAIPPAITSVIFTGLLIALITQLRPLVDWLTPFADDWNRGLATTVEVLVGGAVVAGAVLIMVISFTTLTLALGVLRALRQALALISVAILGALVLFGTGFLPVIGQTVAPVLSAVFGGWMLGIELVGAPFERRGLLRLSDRRAAMRVRRFRVLGFAVPTFLLLAIPFVGVVVFPVATAGGTLLARQLLSEPT